jgi:tRNA (adenine37-N6)-methyltransferase
MGNDRFDFYSIGIIHSPHTELSKIPIQPVFCEGIQGKVIVKRKYIDGLQNLQDFSHIFLFYYFHQSEKTHLHVKPYLSDEKRGIFATRSPMRPNRLGMSLVRLLKIDANILYVTDLDVLDGTPLLDIKPFIKRFDSREDIRSGWQDMVSDDEASLRGIRDFEK